LWQFHCKTLIIWRPIFYFPCPAPRLGADYLLCKCLSSSKLSDSKAKEFHPGLIGANRKKKAEEEEEEEEEERMIPAEV